MSRQPKERPKKIYYTSIYESIAHLMTVAIERAVLDARGIVEKRSRKDLVIADAQSFFVDGRCSEILDKLGKEPSMIPKEVQDVLDNAEIDLTAGPRFCHELVLGQVRAIEHAEKARVLRKLKKSKARLIND